MFDIRCLLAHTTTINMYIPITFFKKSLPNSIMATLQTNKLILVKLAWSWTGDCLVMAKEYCNNNSKSWVTNPSKYNTEQQPVNKLTITFKKDTQQMTSNNPTTIQSQCENLMKYEQDHATSLQQTNKNQFRNRG